MKLFSLLTRNNPKWSAKNMFGAKGMCPICFTSDTALAVTWLWHYLYIWSGPAWTAEQNKKIYVFMGVSFMRVLEMYVHVQKLYVLSGKTDEMRKLVYVYRENLCTHSARNLCTHNRVNLCTVWQWILVHVWLRSMSTCCLSKIFIVFLHRLISQTSYLFGWMCLPITYVSPCLVYNKPFCLFDVISTEYAWIQLAKTE